MKEHQQQQMLGYIPFIRLKAIKVRVWLTNYSHSISCPPSPHPLPQFINPTEGRYEKKKFRLVEWERINRSFLIFCGGKWGWQRASVITLIFSGSWGTFFAWQTHKNLSPNVTGNPRQAKFPCRGFRISGSGFRILWHWNLDSRLQSLYYYWDSGFPEP